MKLMWSCEVERGKKPGFLLSNQLRDLSVHLFYKKKKNKSRIITGVACEFAYPDSLLCAHFLVLSVSVQI